MVIFHCFIDRAELMPFSEAGYKALFLSVDVPVLGKRINEYRNEYTIPDDMSWPNILSHGADHSNRTEYGMSCEVDLWSWYEVMEGMLMFIFCRSQFGLGGNDSLVKTEYFSEDLA